MPVKTYLEGERVSIRKLRLSDAEDIYTHIRAKDMVRWTLAIPHPYPKDGAVKFIRRQQRWWRQNKGYAFAVVLKETKKVVGCLGLNRVDMKHKCAELGFWIGKKYWSKGLTTEAVKLALKFGFGELKLHRIYATALEPNVASRRVLEKCGFQREGIMREAMIKHGKRQNLMNFGILRSEFNPG